jgi:hypothetical protein
MLKQITIGAVMLATLAVQEAGAQEPRNFSTLGMQTVQLPGTSYTMVFSSRTPQVGNPRDDMPAVAIAVASWLSANFGLPHMQHLPRLSYVNSAELEARQSARALEITAEMENPAAYDFASRTIYLPNGWNGGTPREMSLFVRQMAYHLQEEAPYARCATDADKFAFAIQRRWLALFGEASVAPTSGPADSSEPNANCSTRESRVIK